jgi:hypothetical protein
VGKLFTGAFFVASLRLGGHWQLDDSEAAELAAKLDAALATLPAGARPAWLASVMQALEACAPWLAFGGALVAVGFPRVMLTRQLMEQAKIDAAEPLHTAAGDAPTEPAGPVMPTGSPFGEGIAA